MAIIWQKNINDTRYQVRKAGNSTRLYSDGVFHSQHNPHHPVTRGVWDLLMLPAFFQPAGKIRRILVLGVGGGSVLHLLQRYLQPQELVGIELVPVHLDIARRFFGIDKKTARLVCADAIQWLKDYDGPPFDMIIDDLFGEEQGEGVRAAPLTAQWFRLLDKNLSPHGLAVINLISRKSLHESAYFSNTATRRRFPGAYSLTLPQFHNIISAFLKQDATPAALRKRISDIPGLNHRSGPNKLNFRLQKIKPRATHPQT